MYAGQNSQYAACTENGAALLPLEPLLDGSARDASGRKRVTASWRP